MSLPIQIVDEHDQPLCAGTKQEAWNKGLYHRIVRIMIEDTNGNILLQKRSDIMPTFPGRWDNSAAGHVDAGEDYDTAALRELKEELGVTADALDEVKYYKTNSRFEGKKLNRFNKIYKVVVPKDIDLQLQAKEVSAIRWVDRNELAALIEDHPEQISDGLLEAYKHLYQ